jgi:hypothetical protein
MTATEPTILDASRMTRAQRAALPLTTEVAQAIAEQHGVCIRPLAMRRIDTTTGRVEVVPVPCGPPGRTNAHRARRRPAGCGWPSAAKAGTWRQNRSPSGRNPLRTTRN